jgi:hypothetical protein
VGLENFRGVLGASKYINPLGGFGIFRPDEFTAAGIELSFLKMDLKLYSQRRNVFVPGLSIIDILMFNDPIDCKKILEDFCFIKSS